MRAHFFLLCALLGFSASAQTSDAVRLQALEQKFNQSLGLIEQLQKRIAELEKRPGVPAAAPDVSPRVEQLENTVTELLNSKPHAPVQEGLPLHGFLDVNYAKSSNNAPAYERSGFNLGALSLYLTPNLGDHVKGLVELVFEYNREGDLVTDLERLQLGYVVNDNLTLWGGRYHTPLGYWNTGFHHGAQIQTSIARPRLIAFEDQGGILPAHSVGAWASGKFATGVGRVNYDVYVGNAASLVDGTLNPNASGGNVQQLAFGFNVGISPQSVPGLTVGLHGVQHKINSYTGGAAGLGGILNGQVDLRVLGGYVFFESNHWEVIGEYYHFNNTDQLGAAGTHQSSAGFLQGGYRFMDRWTGFARYENAALNQSDPYFNLMNLGATRFGSSYYQYTAGLRYDLDPRSALKLQLEQITDEGNTSQKVNWLRAQYAMRF